MLWNHLFLCCTEVLSPSEHAAQLQRAEILEEFEQETNHCYTLKSVEKVMKKVRTSLSSSSPPHISCFPLPCEQLLPIFATGDSLCAPSGAGLCAAAAPCQDFPHHHFCQSVYKECPETEVTSASSTCTCSHILSLHQYQIWTNSRFDRSKGNSFKILREHKNEPCGWRYLQCWCSFSVNILRMWTYNSLNLGYSTVFHWLHLTNIMSKQHFCAY